MLYYGICDRPPRYHIFTHTVCDYDKTGNQNLARTHEYLGMRQKKSDRQSSEITVDPHESQQNTATIDFAAKPESP